jgi:glycosyltransferase involved in cell wall biosynthesis
MMMRLATAGINYGEKSRDEWIKRGIRPCKLFVAYNALDTDLIGDIKKKLNANIIENFIKERNLFNKKIIIFCGRLFCDCKKPHILIKAMKQVVAEVPEAYAVIIGDGPDKESLIKLAYQLQLSQNILFAGAIHNEECLARYFSLSKVAVMPAAAGLFIQHAFGYGVPIVVGDNIVNHGPEFELVNDGVNGIVCKDEDVMSFAVAICKLLKNESLQQRMSQNAVKPITEKYNVQRMAKGFFDAVEFCLN